MTTIRSILTDTPTEATLLAALVDNTPDAVGTALIGLDLSGIDMERLIMNDDVSVDVMVDWEEIDGGVYGLADVEIEAHGKQLGAVSVPLVVEWGAFGNSPDQHRAVIQYDGNADDSAAATGLVGVLGAVRRLARSTAAAIDFGAIPGDDADDDGNVLVMTCDGDGCPVDLVSRHTSALGAAVAMLSATGQVLVTTRSIDVEIRDDDDGCVVAEIAKLLSGKRVDLRTAPANPDDPDALPGWAKGRFVFLPR